MGVGPLSSFRQLAPGFGSRGFGLPRARPGDVLKSIAQCALHERDRWILWLPVAFGLGIAFYFALPREPSSFLGVALGASGLLVGIVAVGTDAPFARAALGFMAALLIGFAVAKHRTDAVSAPVLSHRLGPVTVQGRVESAQAHGKSIRVVLTLASAGRLRTQLLPKRGRISIRSGANGLKPGDWIAVKAVLMPPPEPAAPGDYDFGRAAFFRQIGAVGFAFGKPTIIAPVRKPTLAEQLTLAVESLRWRVSARIHSVLPGSTGGIASALITGDRGGISDEDESALRDAGLAHVLAIAGLHMALVGLGLFWAVRAFLALFPSIALTQPIKKWAAVAALGSATFYLVISGAATPATRAYIMLAVMLIAILFDRPAISMRSVGIAATIILLLQPETLIEPGFQMSFAAVVGLVAVAEWERSRERSENMWLPFPTVRRYMRGIATTSFVGSVATAPYAAFHFDRATHFAVIGNLGAMPIMGFITMPAAALAIFLMPFGLDEIPLRIMGWGIELMLAVGRWVSDLPGSVSLVSAWPVSALVCLTLGGLWIGLWRTRWRWLGLLPAIAAAVLVFASTPPDILVARDGVTVAVRGADERLHFIRPPVDKYSAEEWLKRDGDSRTLDSAAPERGGAVCDAYGCIMQSHGSRIAAVLMPAALEEDCAANRIVISAVPTRHHCAGPALVIDRFDVARNGAYAVRLADGIQVDTARAERGLRPWSMPAPRRQYRRMRPTSLPWMRTRSAP